MYRILVVDDDDSTRTAVAAALAGADREVTTAKDGEEALTIALVLAPHLVVSDVSMPKRSGFELAHALARRRETALTAVLFLTGEDTPEQRIQGLRLGAVDYLTKPFDVEELTLRVDNALRSCLRAREPFEQGIAGQLSQLGVATLLNVLSLERKTGELELERDGDEAIVRVRGGDVVAATLSSGQLRGAACIQELLRWQEGRFAFREQPIHDTDEIGVPTMALLLDGLRRVDEQDAERKA